MKKHAIQRIIELIGYVGGGLLLFGALLDALSNSISLITPQVAFVGTAVLAVLWIAVEIILPRGGMRWQLRDGKQVTIISLGIRQRLMLLGVALLLWVPQLLVMSGIAPAKQGESGAQRRLSGVVSAALEATRSTTFSVQQRIEMAEVLMKECPDAPVEWCSYFGLSPLNLPNVLPLIMTDGDLYQTTSLALRKRLPNFVNSLKTYEAAFDLKSNKRENLGILKLLLSELRTQATCLELEQQYLAGKLSPAEHKKRFDKALEQQADDLLSKHSR